MEILLPLLYLLLFGFLILKIPFFHLKSFPKWILLFVFVVKVLFGTAVWWIYTYYYPDRSSADIFKYYDDANIIYNACNGNFSLIFQLLSGIVWQEMEVSTILQQSQHWYKHFNFGFFNDNRSIIRLNLFFRLFSMNIFHVHTIFFSFLSLCGLTALYRFFKEQLPYKKALFAMVFLIPTVLLWASAALKESWLIFVLGFFLWNYYQLLKKISFRNLLWTLIPALALIFIKSYVLLCLLPALIFLALTPKNPLIVFIVLHSILILMLLGSEFIFGFNLFETIQAKQDAFQTVAIQSDAGSRIYIPEVDTFWKALRASPRALLNTLFQPWIFQVKNTMQFLSGMENLLFLLLSFAALIFYKRPEKQELIIFLFNLSFVLLLALLIGWTTPISGAIVRYKLPLLPFFAILLLQITDFKKIKYLLSK